MLHLEKLHAAIQALGEQTVAQRRKNAAALVTAQEWLRHAPAPEALREQPLPSEEPGPALAVPVSDEPLDTVTVIATAPPRGALVIGVDGSQIPPDRHAAILYYLLQVGGLRFTYNGQAPTEHTRPTLHYAPSELYDAQEQLIGSQLGMRRTVMELEYLAELVESAAQPGILALTDGPLLWPYSGRSDEERAHLLPAYFAALTRMQQAQALPAGFVERPGGAPLLTLLRTSRPTVPLPPLAPLLSDQALMAELLPPGGRSIWLRRHSAMNERHQQHGQRICFCYLNTGAPDYPVIARVETPEWALAQPEQLDLLHAVLLHQARLLAGYPYVLARAHELALVTSQDKAALEDQLHRQILAHGELLRPSEKARQKGYLSARRR